MKKGVATSIQIGLLLKDSIAQMCQMYKALSWGIGMIQTVLWEQFEKRNKYTKLGAINERALHASNQYVCALLVTSYIEAMSESIELVRYNVTTFDRWLMLVVLSYPEQKRSVRVVNPDEAFEQHLWWP